MTGALYTAQILHNSSGIHCWSEAEVVSFSDGLTLFCTGSQLVHYIDSFENIWVVSVPNLTHSTCILLKRSNSCQWIMILLLFSCQKMHPDQHQCCSASAAPYVPLCPLVPCCWRQIVPGRVSQRRSEVKRQSLCGSEQPRWLNPSVVSFQKTFTCLCTIFHPQNFIFLFKWAIKFIFLDELNTSFYCSNKDQRKLLECTMAAWVYNPPGCF